MRKIVILLFTFLLGILLLGLKSPSVQAVFIDGCGGCPKGETCKLRNVGANQTWQCVGPKPPPVSVPSSPTGLTATCPNPGIVGNVSWAPVAGATAYALRVDDLSNGWMNSCTVTQNTGDICLDNVTTPSYRFVTLPGHTYNWWVHAVNSAGWSAAGGIGPFTCVAPIPPTATPIPTTVPTLPVATPTTAPSCSLHSQGDANCDNKIDNADYLIWKQSMSGETINSSYSADFDNDHTVSILDYEIWRQHTTSFN